MKIVFNSSLPRSGSQLIQNILAQNPRFHCSSTSGLIELLYAARQNFTNLDEFKLQPKGTFDGAWNGFCRGAIEGYYSRLTEKEVAVDKSRGWAFYYDWVKKFYPEAKVIVCVRDLRAIVSSMEKLHRKNAHLADPSNQPAKMMGVTTDQRVAGWMSNPPVGLALLRLQDAIQKGNDKQFHFVVYEKLVANPDFEMDRLYSYLGESFFEHDFNSIAQTVNENDALHGVYGSHDIKPKLEGTAPDWNSVLGKPLAEAIKSQNAWFYERFYP